MSELSIAHRGSDVICDQLTGLSRRFRPNASGRPSCMHRKAAGEIAAVPNYFLYPALSYSLQYCHCLCCIQAFDRKAVALMADTSSAICYNTSIVIDVRRLLEGLNKMLLRSLQPMCILQIAQCGDRRARRFETSPEFNFRWQILFAGCAGHESHRARNAKTCDCDTEAHKPIIQPRAGCRQFDRACQRVIRLCRFCQTAAPSHRRLSIFHHQDAGCKQRSN